MSDHFLEPSFLDYDGPDVGDNLERPEIPPEVKSLRGGAKAAALKQFMDKTVMIAWRSLLRQNNSAQYRAIKSQKSARGHLLRFARRIFEIEEAHFCAVLLDLRDEIAEAEPGSFPIRFSESQVAAMEADGQRAELGVRTLKVIEQRLGTLWLEEGIVQSEIYGEAKSALWRIKAELIAEHRARMRESSSSFGHLMTESISVGD